MPMSRALCLEMADGAEDLQKRRAPKLCIITGVNGERVKDEDQEVISDSELIPL